MSATGTLDMCDSAEGKAGNPSVVVTSNDGKDVLGATALETNKPKDDKTRHRTRLPLPIVEENKLKKQQQQKQKPPNIKITNNTNQENKPSEENMMKQPSIKEFDQFAKKKIGEKEMEENQFPPKDPEDKSRETSIMEVFLGVCHIEERFHGAIKANNEKWKA